MNTNPDCQAMRLSLCLLVATSGPISFSASASPSPPAPTTESTNAPSLLLGAVRIDKATRSLSFPVTVNQRSGIVEYAVVAAGGKTHESVFRTEAQPAHIHLGMLLLGMRPANTNRFPSDVSVPPPGEHVWLEVTWRKDGRLMRCPLEQFIVVGQDRRPLAVGDWIYNGSYLARKNFVAQRDGSIVSVHIDPDALINNPRPGRENDDLHSANSAILPADDVPLEMTVRLSASSGRASAVEEKLTPPPGADASKSP